MAATRGLVSYFGGKQTNCDWLARQFPQQNAWVELFGGGLSSFLAAIKYHQPKLAVVSERILMLRNAYISVKNNPTAFFNKWCLYCAKLKTWDQVRELIKNPTDEVAWLLGTKCSFGNTRNGVGWTTTAKTLKSNRYKKHFLEVSLLLNLPKELRILPDFRESLGFADDSNVYADPPYLGADAYEGHKWAEEEDSELADRLSALKSNVLVTTYSGHLYEGWRSLSRPNTRNAILASKSKGNVEMSRECYLANF